MALKEFFRGIKLALSSLVTTSDENFITLTNQGEVAIYDRPYMILNNSLRLGAEVQIGHLNGSTPIWRNIHKTRVNDLMANNTWEHNLNVELYTNVRVLHNDFNVTIPQVLSFGDLDTKEVTFGATLSPNYVDLADFNDVSGLNTGADVFIIIEYTKN